MFYYVLLYSDCYQYVLVFRLFQHTANVTSVQLTDGIKPYRSYRVNVQAKTGYIVYGPAIKKTIITLPAGEHRVILIYSFYDSMYGLHFIAEALHNQVSFDLNLNHVSVFRLFPHHLFLRQFI